MLEKPVDFITSCYIIFYSNYVTCVAGAQWTEADGKQSYCYDYSSVSFSSRTDNGFTESFFIIVI